MNLNASALSNLRTLRLEQRGRVLVVWIDHPPRNFIGPPLIRDLGRVVRALRHDRTVGAVVLASAVDGAFSTHAFPPALIEGAEAFGRPSPRVVAAAALRLADLALRVPPLAYALRATPMRGVMELREARAVFEAMNRLDKVVVAAVGGTALGGGLELALACDMRVAADGDYRLGFIEPLFGFTTGTGGLQRLTRMVGTQTALAMAVEGQLLSPREAVDAGFVARVVPEDALIAEATALAERLARRSPRMVAAMKDLVYRGGSAGLRRGIALEQAEFVATLSRPAAIEAFRRYAHQLDAIADGSYPADALLDGWLEGTEAELSP
jgi:enoyl-CoA hydratase